MASKLPPWPPVLSDQQRQAICQQATDYALSHSILYRPLPTTSSSSSSSSSSSRATLDAAIHAPLSLLPSPFPRALYAQGQKLQPLYNDLYSRIAVDDAFLRRVIGGNVILVDEFQEKLWQLWKKIKEEGEIVQPLHLGLFRSDYLLHQEEGPSSPLEIKQVEINTISSSFGPLCTRVSDLHRHLTSSGAYDGVSPLLKMENVIKNEALSTLASGLAAAHEAYKNSTRGSRSGGNSDIEPVILFVVQDGERNAFDQRLIEYELLEAHNIRVQRATFDDLKSGIALSSSNRVLNFTKPSDPSEKSKEISVVYYRAGYSPADYPTETEWNTRLQLERSLAIKCPTVALQLAGAKKVQQVLSDPNELEYFVKDPKKGKKVWSDEDISLLRKSFMPMFGMETGSKGIEIASSPTLCKDYVMKPQREGGGNNIYRENIPHELAKLEKLDQERGVEDIKRREGYILMKLIQPPSNIGNYLVRSGNAANKGAAVLAKDVISELGIFGTILFQEDKSQDGGLQVKYEKSGGHLLRTKGRESDEGGVAVGYSVIDSPLLL